MRILGIETSCDETAVAVVEKGTKILSNVVASSQELHQKTGGIIPEVAAREQIKCMIPVIEEAFGTTQNAIRNTYHVSRITNRNLNVDAIAVTIGPGLIGSLLVGIETAKTLAWVWGKPIIPVNHLVGHIYANWLRTEQEGKRVKEQEGPGLPAIALVVSGGHTDLVLMKEHGKIEWIGGTRDDAAGECFDKGARLLGLGYPGGPAIAAAAAEYRVSNIQYQNQISLPRPMMNEDNFDFSFSGLKTAVLREVSKAGKASKVSNEIAYELQEAITDVLVTKTIKAAEKYRVKSILLAGGVSANQRLREKFVSHLSRHTSRFQFLCPPPKLCTDNATYIASCAFFNYKPVSWEQVMVKPSLHF